MGKSKYRKNASPGASGGRRWYVSGKTGKKGSSNNTVSQQRRGGTLPQQEKVWWEGKLVNKSKRDAEIRELAKQTNNEKDEKLIASLDTTPKKLTPITVDKTNNFPSLDINQINKDRRAANEKLYGGIGKEVKKVTEFMSPEEWNALPLEERQRMNESYAAKNTTYFGTEADDERNIFGNMELSERDKKLRELQAGD